MHTGAVPHVPLVQTPFVQLEGLLSDEQSASPQHALQPVLQHFCPAPQAKVNVHFCSVLQLSVVQGLLSLHWVGDVHCGAVVQRPPSAVQMLPGGHRSLFG